MLILLFLPLLNFLIISFFGRFFGRLGVVYLTLYNFITLVVYSCFTGYYVLFMNQTFYINLGI
jgi:hypothetical protein